jgi:Predicted membrane protein
MNSALSIYKKNKKYRTMESEGNLIIRKLKDYYSYNKRLNRWPYFLRTVGIYVFLFTFAAILGVISEIVKNESIDLLISIILVIGCIAAILFMWMQDIKRYHDLNGSGWSYILIRITFNILSIILIGYLLNFILTMHLFLSKGTAGPNKFGPDPLGREASENYNAASLNSEVVDADYEDVDENEKQ